MAASGARRIGAKLFEAAGRSQAMKRMGNEIGEWASGQVVGQVMGDMLDPQGQTAKVGYLQQAGSRKIGAAFFNLAADTLVDALKGPKTHVTVSASRTPTPSTAMCDTLISAAQMPTPVNLMTRVPTAIDMSFRDRILDMSSTATMGLRGALNQQNASLLSQAEPAFSIASVLDQNFSGQKGFLQMFKHKAAETSEPEPSLAQDNIQDAGVDNRNKQQTGKELPQETSKESNEEVAPSRNKM